MNQKEFVQYHYDETISILMATLSRLGRDGILYDIVDTTPEYDPEMNKVISSAIDEMCTYKDVHLMDAELISKLNDSIEVLSVETEHDLNELIREIQNAN